MAFLQGEGFDERIVCEFVEQHEYASQIYSESVNTIRIVTVQNHETQQTEILDAFHRFGNETSKPVDNYSSGGFFSHIDTDTGTLGCLCSLLSSGKRFDVHPDTHAAVAGIHIPAWEKIRNTVLHTHNCFSYYEFMAWDIVLGRDGDVYALEINRGCDLYHQILIPLRNEKFGKWMRDRDLLKKF